MDELLLEMAVDVCGFYCLAMDRQGILCQLQTYGIAHIDRDWIPYCHGHYISVMQRESTIAGIVVVEVVGRRLNPSDDG